MSKYSTKHKKNYGGMGGWKHEEMALKINKNIYQAKIPSDGWLG